MSAGGVHWHVQRLGRGPALLLLHGAAASTHSFRDLAAMLAEDFEVVMVDLPGHGFSGRLAAPTLPRVAEALTALLRRLQIRPVLAIGHSAGAAVLIRMALDKAIAPEALIGLAPALKPYGGAAEGLASHLARLTALNPFAPRVMAWSASPQRVAQLIAKTGSHLDKAGADYYTRLLQDPSHVAGALSLMAHWSLRPLLAALKGLRVPTTFIVGDQDLATPPRDAAHAASLIENADLIELPGLGHLAHEEAPDQIAQIIRRTVAQAAPAPKHAPQPAPQPAPQAAVARHA
jgi:magnesium chelatase accessory protein